MKKISFILLSTLLLVVGCSAEKEEEANSESTGEENSEIEVEKGLLNVEITLPPMLFSKEELAEIEKEMKEQRDAKISQNEDDSITIKLTKNEHKQLMNEMKEEFIQTIDDLIEDEDYPSITDITYNGDFTQLNMIVDREGFENSFDSIAIFSLGITSLFYQVYDGKDLNKDQVVVSLIDVEQDEVFEEIIYPEALEEIESSLDDELAEPIQEDESN